MKLRILAITALLLIAFVSCNSPSGHYDIVEGVVENDLSGNWQVTVEIVTITEKQAYSTINIDLLDPVGCGHAFYGLKISNDDYLGPEKILEFMDLLTGHHIGVTKELQILNNEHHYEAALGIADFENDILATLNEGAIKDLFELYYSTETDSKQLSMSGVFDDNKLTLSLEETIFEFISIGELTIEENDIYNLNGDFSWDTDYFVIEGSWTATRS